MNKQPAVYFLVNKKNGTIYVGVTSDLVQRVWEHKNNMVEGFTKRYHVHQLVWYELHESMESAIIREKRIKDWERAWKIQLIEPKIQIGLICIIRLFSWIPAFAGMTGK